MRREVSAELIAHAWARLRFGGELSREPFDRLVMAAQAAGFLRGGVDLNHFVALARALTARPKALLMAKTG